MKHLFNKKILQGGGKDKPKPQPAVLRPPEIGNFQILNSYSVAEVVDLISDGPIEGLVNQNGQILGSGPSILQGVYLDNTPIQVTDAQSNQPPNTDKIFHIDIQSGLNKFGDTYYDYDSKSYKYYKFPIISSPSLTPKVNYRANQTSLLMAKVDSTLYSPLTNKTIGESGNGWIWKGSKYIESNLAYFATTSGTEVEIHYKKDSLFAADTILNKLSSEISSEINSLIDNPLQQQWAIKAQSDLGNFKSQYFDETDHSFNWKSKNNAFVVVKIGSQSNRQFAQSDIASNFSAADSADAKKLANVFFNLGDFEQSFASSDITKIIIPSIYTDTDNSKKYTKQLFGCIIFRMNTYSSYYSGPTSAFGITEENFYRIYIDNVIPFTQKTTALNLYKGSELRSYSKSNKYNFLNVSCEFKDGSEDQIPLQYFKNIFVDYDYNSKLMGPFKKGFDIQRLKDLKTVNTNNPTLSVSLNDAISNGADGSVDIRDINLGKAGGISNEDYSSWNGQNSLDEDATPITHTIENPNVSSVYLTLAISSLSDTVEIDKEKGAQTEIVTDKTVKAGSKIPSIVNFKVEYGKITNGQVEEISKTIKTFSVLALIEGQMLIDLGCPDSKISSDLQSAVKEFSSSDGLLNPINNDISFKLPALINGENPTLTKRYIKVTKLSAETNSILINKEIYLNKVTEIVENDLSYPFSSLVGVKLDARSFSSVPERSYDCRLKKIQIPNNYSPLNADGSDKRYIKKSSDYNGGNKIYDGDWNGQFKEGWTDNPAWIIYDLLTSKRYGLGSYIDESQINKWELYKIARFCDAVDDDGFFVGVSDGVGGLEPRYSCNIIFREQTKIFDAINVVASLFRGIVFFSNSEIHFLDDRPRTPIAIFTNSNVKDGVFNYTNSRRDQQFNTVEVAYLDRFDNYQSKVEYVQDESDIRKRGIFKTTINTLGVTSRAMARRIGQHIIYQTIKENQGVEFLAGLESLLCRPGDLIILEDELKTRASNYGRILDVNVAEKSLIIDNSFSSDSMNYAITVYTPTGYSTNAELNALSDIERNRVDYFDVTGSILGNNLLTGSYYFSGYGEKIYNQYASGIQYPLYTGVSTSHNQNLYCYYNTGYTGFVFSTGKAFQDNIIYDKIITNTGLLDIFDVVDQTTNYATTGFDYTAIGNRRGSDSGSISGAFKFYQSNGYSGPLLSEVEGANHPQITRFALSGHSGADFGSKVYISGGDINANLVSKIALGSPYRLERKNASDQIYKIISIREQNQNEYSVVASKYNTGKFVEIENFIAEDFLPQTYSTAPTVINNVEIKELPVPSGITFSGSNITTNGFSLSASWNGDPNRTGTKVEIYNSIYSEYYEYNVSPLSGSYLLTGLSSLGQWKLKLTNLGNGSSYLNSIAKETGTFIAYTGTLTAMPQPAIINFSIT
jgi:hypothetical protein